MAGSQRRAVNATVKALRDLGRLEPVDTALVVSAQGLADACDADPTNAAMWRELRAALQSLLAVGDGNPDDDSAAFLSELRASVGNS